MKRLRKMPRKGLPRTRKIILAIALIIVITAVLIEVTDDDSATGAVLQESEQPTTVEHMEDLGFEQVPNDETLRIE